MKLYNALALLLCLTFLQSQAQSDDSFTRYELLDPATQSFRILYEVSATTAGDKYYFNTLRKGSDHKVDGVTDQMSGKSLPWTIVNGADAKAAGLKDAENDVDYLKVTLARPIVSGSEYRLLIDKTYKDTKSYFNEGDRIVFSRSLGIKRNSIVLPKGYELVKCNYPSQVILENDGRIKVSFINSTQQEVLFRIEARKLPLRADVSQLKFTPDPEKPGGQSRDKSKARINFEIPDRAHQTREIVYFLQQPETSSFRLYHDYTETREGMDHYVNVVRAGSKASGPSAKNLDTGQDLKVETLVGEAIKRKGLDIGEEIKPETEVIVIWYDAVQKGFSTRIRIEETYTDTNRYLLSSNELVWDRSFGRPHNTVILPEGWFLTANAVPATVDIGSDGKIILYYVNDDPEDIDVFIKGRRR